MAEHWDDGAKRGFCEEKRPQKIDGHINPSSIYQQKRPKTTNMDIDKLYKDDYWKQYLHPSNYDLTLDEHYDRLWRVQWFLAMKQLGVSEDIICENQNVTFDMYDNTAICICDGISANPNMKLNNVNKSGRIDEINWGLYTKNPCVSMDEILDDIFEIMDDGNCYISANKLNWDMNSLRDNPNYTIDIKLLEDICVGGRKNKYSYCKSHFWKYLSSSFPLDMLLKMSHIMWNWDDVSNRNDVTEEVVVKHINKPWNWEILLNRIKIYDGISLDFMLRASLTTPNIAATILGTYKSMRVSLFEILHRPTYPWNYDEISKITKIDICEMLEHPDLFKMRCICENPNITTDILLKNSHINWDWNVLSKNSNLTPEKMTLHKELPWNWKVVSKRTDLTSYVVLINPMLDWDYDEIVKNPKLIYDIIKAYPTKIWNWSELNPHNIMIVYEFSEKDWNWNELSGRNDLSMQFVINNPTKNWDWYTLSENSNLTTGFILNNPSKPWNWKEISKRHALPFTLITKNLDEIENLNDLHVQSDIQLSMVLENPRLLNGFADSIGKYQFIKSRENYIATSVKNILILTIYEHLNKPENYIPPIACTREEDQKEQERLRTAEQVFFDSYIFQHLIKY